MSECDLASQNTNAVNPTAIGQSVLMTAKKSCIYHRIKMTLTSDGEAVDSSAFA